MTLLCLKLAQLKVYTDDLDYSQRISAMVNDLEALNLTVVSLTHYGPLLHCCVTGISPFYVDNLCVCEELAYPLERVHVLFSLH